MTVDPGKSKPVLFGYAKSSCTWRVRAALTHKNVDYIMHSYDPYGEHSDQEQTDYLKLNPLGVVPTLQIDGNSLTQSIAILEYLEETRPHCPLLPRDPIQRSKVRQIVELINSGIHPLQKSSVACRSTQDPVEQKKFQLYWIEKGLEALELYLQESSGKCCVGDEISFADLCVVPQMFSSRKFGADISRYPTCARIYECLLETETFGKSHPDTQPFTIDNQSIIEF